MVKLNVVDFVSSLGLESLVDQVVFSVSDPQLLIIENRSETSIANKSTVALVLILKERLDKQSSMSNVCTDSLHHSIQLNFFLLR